MHNVALHLSRVATLPEHTLAAEMGSSENVETNWWPTNSGIPGKIHILTDVSVAHSPEWTWGHQQDHPRCRCKHSSWSASASPWTTLSVNWTGVLSFLSSFWIFALVPTLNWKYQQLLCNVSFKPIQTFNRHMVFFFWKACVTNTTVTCMSFPLPWKIAKWSM